MGENQRDSIRRLSYSDGKVKIQNPIHMSQIQGKKGIISIELNTVKDINNKFRAYNLVISVFSAKNNYIRNNIKKHVVDIKYAKDDLSQVNPQLYEWLAIINDKSSYDDRLPQNSYKSNPSQQNNSDSGEEFSDPNGRYSKDDTIFDDFEDEEVMFTADGDIAFDGFGADAQRTIDVKEMVQDQGAEHAVYTLYNAAALEMVLDVAAEIAAAKSEKTAKEKKPY